MYEQDSVAKLLADKRRPIQNYKKKWIQKGKSALLRGQFHTNVS